MTGNSDRHNGIKPSTPDAELPLEERSLPDALGIEIQFAPDDLAPPVDLDRLRAFVRNKLDATERAETRRLIGMFRSWHTAWGNVLREGLED